MCVRVAAHMKLGTPPRLFAASFPAQAIAGITLVDDEAQLQAFAALAPKAVVAYAPALCDKGAQQVVQRSHFWR